MISASQRERKKLYDREYRLKHLQRLRLLQAQRKREVRLSNPEKHRAASKKAYWKNRDRRLREQNAPEYKLILAMYHQFRKVAFPELFKEKNRRAYARMSEEERCAKRKRRETPEWKSRRARSVREERRNNPEKRILHCCRSRIRAAICGKKKSVSTRELIGCDIADLMRHLESKFKPRMAWNNYGIRGWHIDHIRPCSSFNLLNENELRTCFHFSNLQPLWAAENIRKKDKQWQ